MGRNRAVYPLDETHVIKIPLSWDGITDNEREASTYAQYGSDGFIPYAPCKIIHTKEGIPLLKMERVTPTHIPYKDGPEWLGWVDCGQAGYNREGRLLAYDYGT